LFTAQKKGLLKSILSPTGLMSCTKCLSSTTNSTHSTHS